MLIIELNKQFTPCICLHTSHECEIFQLWQLYKDPFFFFITMQMYAAQESNKVCAIIVRTFSVEELSITHCSLLFHPVQHRSSILLSVSPGMLSYPGVLVQSM